MTTERFRAEYEQNPRWVGGYRVVLGGVGLCQLTFKPEYVRLNSVLIPAAERGRGQGAAVLTYVTTLADHYGVELRGRVRRFGSSATGLKQGELRHWYSRHGFAVERSGGMRRPPRPLACTTSPPLPQRTMLGSGWVGVVR